MRQDAKKSAKRVLSVIRLYTKKSLRWSFSYAKSISFGVRHLEFSPIKGPEGNIEYLLYLHKPEQASEETVTGEEALAKAEKECPVSSEQVVEEAHMELDKT